MQSTGKIAREAQVPYQFFATTPFDSFITHSFWGSSTTCITFSTEYFFSLHVLNDEMIAVANMKRVMQVSDDMPGKEFDCSNRKPTCAFCDLIKSGYPLLHSERKVFQ